ncbi:TPA: hypothetical protein LR286_003260 [Enterobacter hormaechei]|nr:hypothetical protein [Enterobacter hormaechei]HBL9125592.1 hypothetical protein [Enterobacter hormaechei]HCC6647861.1 hypothetical protein [Enterobacter hormaechei]
MSFDIYLSTKPLLEDFIDPTSFNNLDDLSKQQVLGAVQRHETGHASVEFVAEIVHAVIALAKKQKGLAHFTYDTVKGIGSYRYDEWPEEVGNNEE